MKQLKLKKAIIGLLVTASILTLRPFSTIAHAEWKQSSNGGWWYKEGTSNYATGWMNIGGNWFYFSKDGYMQTGWIYDSGNWYYLYSDGSMATNTTIDGYYLSSTGAWSTSGNSLDSRKVSGGTVGNDTENAQKMGNQNGYSQQSNDASQYPENDPRSRGVSGQVSTGSNGKLSENMQNSQQSQKTNSSDPFAPISGTAGNDPTNAQKMGNANK